MQALDTCYAQTSHGGRVPVEHQPVHDLVRSWIADVIDSVENFDDVYSYDTEPEEIENEHRSGFIPWTEGGWIAVLNACLAYAHGSGGGPKAVQPIIDSTLDDAAVAFCEDRKWKLPSEGAAEAAWVLIGALPDDSDDREAWYEWENEWLFEGGTYFYKVRAIYYMPDNSDNQTGEPEVYFDAYLNIDFEYGRDSIPWLSAYGQNTDQTSGTWKRTIPVREITPELIAELTQQAIEALAST